MESDVSQRQTTIKSEPGSLTSASETSELVSADSTCNCTDPSASGTYVKIEQGESNRSSLCNGANEIVKPLTCALCNKSIPNSKHRSDSNLAQSNTNSIPDSSDNRLNCKDATLTEGGEATNKPPNDSQSTSHIIDNSCNDLAPVNDEPTLPNSTDVKSEPMEVTEADCEAIRAAQTLGHSKESDPEIPVISRSPCDLKNTDDIPPAQSNDGDGVTPTQSKDGDNVNPMEPKASEDVKPLEPEEGLITEPSDTQTYRLVCQTVEDLRALSNSFSDSRGKEGKLPLCLRNYTCLAISPCCRQLMP